MNQRFPQKLARAIAILAVLFAFAVSLGKTTGAQAQEQSDLKLNIEAGLGSYCKQGTWIPVRVTVENSGRDLDARISLRNKTYGAEILHATDVTLPNSSRKAITLYAPASDSTGISFTTRVEADGKVLATSSVRIYCTDNESRIIGVAADDVNAFNVIESQSYATKKLRTAPLDLADLPEREEGWEALDALILSGVDTGVLNQAQRSALSAWVSRGGILLVAGGPKWQAVSAGLDSDLIPVQVHSTQKVQALSALSQYLRRQDALSGEATLSVGTVQEGAEVLIWQGEIPLLVEKQIGFGKVLYLAADPALRPLNTWDGIASFYDVQFSSYSKHPHWLDGWENYAAEQAASTLDNILIPSSLTLLCWLGTYIVMIGPINYLLLKRLKRNHLAWASIPTLAIFFTAIAYFAGGMARGSAPILNRLSVVQAWEGQDQAQVQEIVGVYSPTRATYTLRGENSLIFPTSYSNISAWTDIQSGSNSELPDIRIEAGGMKTFLAQGHTTALPIEHNLELRLSNQTPKLVGTITNHSSHSIKNALIVVQGHYRRLGDIGPGKTVNVDLTLLTGDGPFYTMDASTLLRFPESTEDSKEFRQISFFNSVMNSYNAEVKGNWGVYLMGWLDTPALELTLAEKQAEMIDTTLYIVSLRPSIRGTGNVWRITAGIMAWESSDVEVSPYGINGYLSGEYSLSFKPAFPLGFKSVDALSFQWDTQNPSARTILIWDFVNNEWHVLENPQVGSNEIPDPSRFVGPNGELRVQIGDDPNYDRVSASYFTLTVKP